MFCKGNIPEIRSGEGINLVKGKFKIKLTVLQMTKELSLPVGKEYRRRLKLENLCEEEGEFYNIWFISKQ